MTTQQLRQLYDFAGLPFSTEEGEVIHLKKTILLELKSSDDSLLVGGQFFGKQDLLALFESGLPDARMNIAAFEQQYPWIALLRVPATIHIPVDIPEQLFTDEMFRYFSSSEAPVLYAEYKQTIKLRMDENDLLLTHALLTYLPILSEQQQYEVKELVKSLFLAKYTIVEEKIARKESGNPPPEERFFLLPEYYDVLRIVAYDDVPFLMHQADVFVNMLEIISIVSGKGIARYQMELPLPPRALGFLRMLTGTTFKAERLSARRKAKSKYIWIGLGIILVVMLFSSC